MNSFLHALLSIQPPYGKDPFPRLWGRQVVVLTALGSWMLGGLFELPSLAQVSSAVVPDATLGSDGSLPVGPPGQQFILGGLSQGRYLFHSFEQFDIGAGNTVTFPTAPGIDTIFTRVTGSQASRLDGQLEILEPDVDFFLLNPNGIFFGPNVALDLSGSFFATTASDVLFSNGERFGTQVPQATNPLLTVAPTALAFQQSTVSPIVNSGGTLAVVPGKRLSLIGGPLRLEGGKLLAPQGSLELVSLGQPDQLSLLQQGSEERGYQYSVIPPIGVDRGQIQLINQAQLSTSSILPSPGPTLPGSKLPNPGIIRLWGSEIQMLEQAQILARALPNDQFPIASATVELDASDRILLDQGSLVEALTDSAVASGDIRLSAKRVELRDRARILLDTATTAPSGNLTITTSTLFLDSQSRIDALTTGDGMGGNIDISQAERVSIVNSSKIQTESRAAGVAGNLTVDTTELLLKDGGQLGASARNTGKGGRIAVVAENAQLVGVGPGVASGLVANTEGPGAAGGIQLTAQYLSLSDGAQISSSSRGPRAGPAGNIDLTVTEQLQAEGTSPQNSANNSGIFAISTEGSLSPAGQLTIDTGKLILREGASISTSTSGRGEGESGTLSVNATELVQLSGVRADGQAPSGLLVGTSGNAMGGDLTLKTPQLTIQAGAAISADSAGQGDSGQLDIQTEKLTIRDPGSRISVRAEGTGAGGDIKLGFNRLLLEDEGQISAETASGAGGNLSLLGTDLLVLRRGGKISTNAKGPGNGGDITLDNATGFIVAVPSEDSDISANAVEGRGGNVAIKTQGLFGIQFRNDATFLSDVTASSEFGLNGNVDISILQIDPAQGLTQLPETLVDPANQIAQSCLGQDYDANRFVVSGRGGMPLSPTNPLRSQAQNALWIQSGTIMQAQASSYQSSSHQLQTIRPIPEPVNSATSLPAIEANYWLQDSNGTVRLLGMPTQTLARLFHQNC